MRKDSPDFAKDRSFNSYSDNRSVQENFDVITSFIQESAEEYIRSKKTKKKPVVRLLLFFGSPEIRRKIRRRNKIHAKAKRPN